MRISIFMQKFINIMQMDDDMTVSDEEIENLKHVLYFSTITSVRDNDFQSDKSDDDWHYRYANKDIAKKLNEKIYNDLNEEFGIWQPRKNNGSRRISETWSVNRRHVKNVNFEFDFFLRTDYTIKTTFLNFAIYSKRPSMPENIFELFGEIKGYEKNERSYNKNNVFSFFEANNDIINEMYQKIKLELEVINQYLQTE